MNQFKLAGCVGKIAFSSFSLAHKSLRHNEKRRGVYHCPQCGEWHVGTGIKKPMKKPKTRYYEETEDAERWSY